VTELAESAVQKLRKHYEEVEDSAAEEEEIGDDFENLYKGQISKSGTPILPSKRARKIPEKIQVFQEDLAALSATAKPELDAEPEVEPELDAEPEVEGGAEETDVFLEQVPEAKTEVNPEDTDPTNN